MAERVLRQWLPLSTLLSLWDDKSGFGSTQCLLAKSRAFTSACNMILGKSLNILSIKVEDDIYDLASLLETSQDHGGGRI